MSFCVPGITHCNKHWKRIDLIDGCEDCKKEMKKVNDLIKTILKEYTNIRIEKGDYAFELEDMEMLLQMLDTSTLGDVLADLKAHKKTIV